MALQHNTNGLIFKDDFNRANGPPGGNWTVISGNWQIVGNALRNVAVAENNRITVADAVFGAARGEMVVQVRMRKVDPTNDNSRRTFPGIMARLDTVANHYFMVEITNNAVSGKRVLARIAGGASTQLAEAGNEPHHILEKYKLAVKNSEQKVWYKDVLDMQSADATHNAVMGKAGLRNGWFAATDDYAEFDDFAVYKTNRVICTALPAGHKIRIGALVAAEIAGIATIDLAGLTCPLAILEQLDATNSVVDSITPADGVWGGDEYGFFIPEVPTWMPDNSAPDTIWAPCGEAEAT